MGAMSQKASPWQAIMEVIAGIQHAAKIVFSIACFLQVSIVPLVTVNISELLSRDSDDHEQAAVTIKPRHPVSQEKLVSVVLEYTLKKPSLESSHPVSMTHITSMYSIQPSFNIKLAIKQLHRTVPCLLP